VCGSEGIKEITQAARALSCYREVGENEKTQEGGRRQRKGGTN